MPPQTHAKKTQWVSVAQALGSHNLPELDAADNEGASNSTTHGVPHQCRTLKGSQLEWIAHTRQGKTAFENTCTSCTGLPDGGIEARTELFCSRCGAQMPRPWVYDKKLDYRRVQRAWAGGYGRLCPHHPANTLTSMFMNPSSTMTLHPYEDRCLSVREGAILQSIDVNSFRFAPDVDVRTMALLIGESVPPAFFAQLAQWLIQGAS